MLDLTEQLAHGCKAIDPSASRPAGLAYAVRVLTQSYGEHPVYRQ